jgi:hypothetical protein
MDTLLMAASLAIPDAAVGNAMRLRLGMSQMPLAAPLVLCDCSKPPTPLPPVPLFG